ncbi:hypothetical protein EPO05_01040 [Patescibacteria group bacterium]|nr:MAG: hypothetical protein EPO05_01040 [Patescibacteria group bacterium]
MAIEPAVLAELKDRLVKEKAELEKELAQIAKPTEVKGEYETNFDQLGSSEDDNSVEAEEYVDNRALEGTLEKQLKEVSDALNRMEDGTYGSCSNCGQEISLERLKAYPAAKTCLQCK